MRYTNHLPLHKFVVLIASALITDTAAYSIPSSSSSSSKNSAALQKVTTTTPPRTLAFTEKSHSVESGHHHYPHPQPVNQKDTMSSRRSILTNLVATAAATMSVTTLPSMVWAQDTVPSTTPIVPPEVALESVYFGVGCFWHIQHEFIAAERDLLGRSDRELTSFTGYAGGNTADTFGRVCYHNFQNVADYGKFGHGEVVGMKLPTEKIVDFAKVYFSLYNPKTLGTRFDDCCDDSLFSSGFLVILWSSHTCFLLCVCKCRFILPRNA
jgi:hypothetical protein